MTNLNPTGPRLDLMRAIADNPGSVVYLRRWGSDPDEVRHQPDRDRGRGKNVTGVYRDLERARLVKCGPATHASMYAPQIVELTDAGREWLATHDKERAR